MKFSAERETILAPLQAVIGVVERRQTMPILANVLVVGRGEQLSITATDLEVELVARTNVSLQQAGDVTLPGRKLLDIVRALPEKTQVTVSIESEKATIRSGRSRFTLATLPASDFPTVEDIRAQQTLTIAQPALKRLLDKTHFSMAQQDVRYYLNGMLLESDGKTLRTVATDGHRLAVCEAALDSDSASSQQVIVPRKGVLELQRLLGNEGSVELAIGSNHVRAQIGDIRFTSKLIDGRFPEYGRVIPANPSKQVEADREGLRQALQRTAILSNEKYRGVRVSLKPDLVTIQAHNPEQEEAEDQVEVTYKGDEVEIGFNVTYLLDALAAVDSEKVILGLTDGNSSCLVRAAGGASSKYVVMPMRLESRGAHDARSAMSLAELRIENLRCIESAALEFSPELNLIAGENGAGKTSVLEAIFLLGRGRSFRTRSTERLIRHHEPKLTVFGRTDDSPPKRAGVEVASDGGTRARIDGANAISLLELTGVLPVQAIDPEVHKLVDQGAERR